MHDLLGDLRYGWRVLARSPGFTLVAVLMMALGIGANAALFSIVNALLLRPLPYPDPDRVVSVSLMDPSMHSSDAEAPDWGYLLWRASSRCLVQAAAYNEWSANVAGRNASERLQGAAVAGDFFSILGARPVLGRALTDQRTTLAPSGPYQVVLGHAAWERLTGGDSGVIGRTMELSGKPAIVVGVLPPSFDFPHGAQFWVPFEVNARAQGGGFVSYFLQVIGRLRPGVSIPAARSELDGLWRQNPSLWDAKMWASARVDMVSLHERLYGASRPLLLLLFGAVALVLLVACSNLASMLLARAASRGREFAIRAALGAGRARVVRQVLAESLLLSVLGGAAGLLIAQWGIALFAALSPAMFAGAPPIGINGAALAFTAIVALVTGALFGLAPALSASRLSVVESLKSGSLSVAGGGPRPVLRQALVIGQLAAALVLVIAATLLTRSLVRLLSVDPGFRAHGLVAARVSLAGSRYHDVAAANAFYAELLDRVANLKGVRSAALAEALPLGRFMRIYSFKMDGVQEDRAASQSFLNAVTTDYFRTVGATLVAGRGFTLNDQLGAPRVAVVNVAFARRFLGGGDPIGRRIELPNEALGSPIIVGEVNDIRQIGREEPAEPETFLPAAQSEYMPSSLVVLADGKPGVLAAEIRATVRGIDASLPIAQISLLEDELAKGAAPRRANAILLGLFGAVALLIAGMGLYGLMAFIVTQRTREIGVRVALGAGRRDVLRLVVGHSVGLIAMGIVLGLVAALAFTGALRGMLFGITADDPVTFIAVPIVLAAIALLATYLPARRATKVNPVVALSAE